jgi:hypothetical protein
MSLTLSYKLLLALPTHISDIWRCPKRGTSVFEGAALVEMKLGLTQKLGFAMAVAGSTNIQSLGTATKYYFATVFI